MRIKKEDTLVMVIDFQERLMPVIDQQEKIIETSKILLNGVNELEVPVLVTRQYPNGLGDTVEDIREVTKDAKVLDKIEFSCYGNEEIKKYIKETGKKNIIIIGAEAHICVLQTIIDLEADGYQTVLIEDCISSRTKESKENGVKRAMQEGALISNTEAILFELLEKAGSDSFKVISNLIK